MSRSHKSLRIEYYKPGVTPGRDQNWDRDAGQIPEILRPNTNPGTRIPRGSRCRPLLQTHTYLRLKFHKGLKINVNFRTFPGSDSSTTNKTSIKGLVRVPPSQHDLFNRVRQLTPSRVTCCVFLKRFKYHKK